jgi:hypothetical protein
MSEAQIFERGVNYSLKQETNNLTIGKFLFMPNSLPLWNWTPGKKFPMLGWFW